MPGLNYIKNVFWKTEREARAGEARLHTFIFKMNLCQKMLFPQEFMLLRGEAKKKLSFFYEECSLGKIIQAERRQNPSKEKRK